MAEPWWLLVGFSLGAMFVKWLWDREARRERREQGRLYDERIHVGQDRRPPPAAPEDTPPMGLKPRG